MMDVAGTFLLILIYGSGGLGIQEMRDFESCKAALVQLEPQRRIHGLCIAATTIEETLDD